MNHTSAELKQMARANLSNKWNAALGLTALQTLIVFALTQCITLFQSTTPLGTTVYIIVNLIISLLTTLLSTGASFFYLKICRGREYKITDMFAVFKMNPDRFLIVALIQNLLLLVVQIPLYIQPVSTITTLSDTFHIIIISAACSIAGSLVSTIFSMFFGISYYLMLDFPELEAIASMRLSATLMRGNKWRYFYIFALSFLGWKFLGGMSLGLGYLWITPYITMTLTYFYCDVLEQLREADPSLDFPMPEQDSTEQDSTVTDSMEMDLTEVDSTEMNSTETVSTETDFHSETPSDTEQ